VATGAAAKADAAMRRMPNDAKMILRILHLDFIILIGNLEQEVPQLHSKFNWAVGILTTTLDDPAGPPPSDAVMVDDVLHRLTLQRGPAKNARRIVTSR